MKLPKIALSLLLVAMLAACQRAPEAPAPVAAVAPPAASPASAPTAAHAEVAEAAQAPTVVPDTADGVWQAIDGKQAELKAAIGRGELGKVHHLAFAIRDLMAALPAKLPGLDDSAKADLQGKVGFVQTLADRLDQSGDAGDHAATQASYEQLAAVLDSIPRRATNP
jgi:hypothetical protein